jgi:hypothetical protein
MSWTPALDMPVPIKVDVVATSGRGMTAEEVTDLALNKLISISDTAPPELAVQAKAFKERMRMVLVHYMRQAIASDRTTVYNILKDAGHPDLAETIRGL